MDSALIIERLRKIEDDARSLRLEIESGASTAPEDFTTEPPQERPQVKRQFKVTPPSSIRDPLAKTAGDLLTARQLGLIRNLAREKGVDYEMECRQVFKCDAAELSRKAASSFIDHLEALEPEFTARRA